VSNVRFQLFGAPIFLQSFSKWEEVGRKLPWSLDYPIRDGPSRTGGFGHACHRAEHPKTHELGSGEAESPHKFPGNYNHRFLGQTSCRIQLGTSPYIPTTRHESIPAFLPCPVALEFALESLGPVLDLGISGRINLSPQSPRLGSESINSSRWHRRTLLACQP